MRLLLRNLQVNELIVHDIPMKLSQRILRETPNTLSEKPVFSQVASPVNLEICRFFLDRIAGTIGSTFANDVIFDPLTESPVGTLMNEYFFENGNNRISITQQIAQHLFDIQNAQNSSGLLLFLRCSTGEDTVLAVLKVEREEGVRVKQQIVNDGLMTFDIEHIRDLMLTKKTKLFKIVLFYLEEEIIKGILCDQQRGYNNNDIADFFISNFLGCILTEEPKILTKNFFEATQKYINDRIDSSEKKGELLNHLISELTDQRRMISSTEFARRTLPADQRDDFIQYIQDNGATIGDFTKECSLIVSRLKNVKYDFISGISVFGSQDAITAKSRVTDMPNGEMKMEIIDQLKLVKSK